MDIGTIVVSVVGASVSSGGIVGIITARTARRKAPADIAVMLTESAMRQVNELQERLADAERLTDSAAGRARAAEREVENALIEVHQLRRVVADLTDRVGQLVRWIHDPYMTIENLRLRVPPPTSDNGGSH